MPSRRSDASHAARRLRRDDPTSFVSPPIANRALVASDDLVPLALDGAAGDLLRHALAVDVGGVDEVAAGVDEAVDDLLARGLVGLVAERHRAEAELRDACAGAAELAVFHGGVAPDRGRGDLTAAGRDRAITGRRSSDGAVPCVSGGGGRNRTHRTGFARPTRFEDEGGHQTPFTSGRILAGRRPGGQVGGAIGHAISVRYAAGSSTSDRADEVVLAHRHARRASRGGRPTRPTSGTCRGSSS